eukprot:c4657_g1_i1.p2 GENE.c4657_g1_i1~~c4657_g1_i1.p2  ORF type:complete len:233 (+),score=86.42 c4657_g1_i1:34-699(+)
MKVWVLGLLFIISTYCSELKHKGFLPVNSNIAKRFGGGVDDSESTYLEKSDKTIIGNSKPSCFEETAEEKSQTNGLTSLLEVQETATPGDYGQFFMKLVPGVHGKLYGRSLVAPCRCEACAYVLDTLVMYLDEDTMGWFLPDDVEHVMQDRFCYGVKWIYRSACHHILTAYYEEIVTMVMGHLTGVDMCRVLRFCPFHFSTGNWMWPQKNPMVSDQSRPKV